MMSDADPITARRLRLWIDAAGCWELFWREQLRVGGANSKADLKVNALFSGSLPRFRRDGEWILIENQGQGMLVDYGEAIPVGPAAALAFHRPSRLTNTVRIAPEPPFRLTSLADGMLWLDRFAVLGPGSDAHVHCPTWSEEWIVAVHGDRLVCRSGAGFVADDGSRRREFTIVDSVTLSDGVGTARFEWYDGAG